MDRIYLDHAATTPLILDAFEAMRPWLTGGPSNPSSLHRSGQRARAAVETAREQVAAALNAAPGEIVFTSGATEADALGLIGTLRRRGGTAPLIVGATEHAAVLRAAEAEGRAGRTVHTLPPSRGAAPCPAGLESLLHELPERPALVAVMRTNNETGDTADVPALAGIAREAGAAFLCDAVQAFGAEPLDVRAMGVDMLAISSHKIGGPQGVGALWIRDGHRLAPLALGGSQERGLRAGTQPVAAIAGFGAAAEAAVRGLGERAARCAELRDRLQEALTRIPGVRANGGPERGPKHTNVRVDGTGGEALLMALDDAGVEVSAGSACAAGSLEPSHVLIAMGLDRSQAASSVRFSLSPTALPSEETIDVVANRVARAVARLRALPAEATAPL